MYKRMMMLLILASVTGALGFAQSTWQDLKFGMTCPKAKELLAKKGLNLDCAGDAGVLMGKWEFNIPGIRSFNFMPSTVFHDDKLEQVYLKLLNQPLPANTMVLFANDIYRQLTGKYGTPISTVNTYGTANYKEGVCDADSMGIASLVNRQSFALLVCKATWRAQDQTVTLDWSYYDENTYPPDVAATRTFDLSITYEPQSKGL